MQKLYNSEMKVLDVVWENEPISAKEISAVLAETIGWNKNTTYTVINKLVKKEIIRREDPGFICSAIVSREEAKREETDSLIKKFFGGSKKALFSALLEDENLTGDDIRELKEMIDRR